MSTLSVAPNEERSLTERVAEEVRAYMARRQMTQTRLAQILELPQSAVSARVRGKIAFRIDELEQVADALGVHPAVLLGGRSDGNGPSPSGTRSGAYRTKVNTQRDAKILPMQLGSRSRPTVKPPSPKAA